MIYDDMAIGPVGAHDAAVLSVLTSYMHAPRVLEFGSYKGHSAYAFLKGGASRLVCVEAEKTAELVNLIDETPGSELVVSDQSEFRTDEQFDIVFFDASHDLGTNMQTLINVLPNLAPGGIIIIHDTGAWAPEHMGEEHRAFPGVDTPAGKVHQPGELEFVRLLETYGWNRVSIGSRTSLRHGLTICQPPNQ